MTLKRLPVLVLMIGTTVLPLSLLADGMSRTDPGLIGTWNWLSAESPAGRLEPAEDAEYTVTFTEEGTVHLEFEINRINGTYEADGTTLTIVPPMVMTLAAWQPHSPAPALLTLLEASGEYTVSAGSLSVRTASGTMEFGRP